MCFLVTSFWFFFFKQKTAYEVRISDWSSDVCSSDLFTITASIGIARAPEHGDRPQTLIHNADAAMYDSKRRIRNGWQVFTPALAQTQQDRLRVETHLRRAADNNAFHLVYQDRKSTRLNSSH